MNNTEKITAKANQAKRTFTIRKYVNGKLFTKYKTIRMNKDEFNNCECNTENDWKYYLKGASYYEIKS